VTHVGVPGSMDKNFDLFSLLTTGVHFGTFCRTADAALQESGLRNLNLSGLPCLGKSEAKRFTAANWVQMDRPMILGYLVLLNSIRNSITHSAF
jgi:hypothetical protein